MDNPTTIVVPDTVYTPSAVQEISRLRHERWAILAALSNSADDKEPRLSDSQKDGFRLRLIVIHKRLFKLTGNTIYCVR